MNIYNEIAIFFKKSNNDLLFHKKNLASTCIWFIFYLVFISQLLLLTLFISWSDFDVVFPMYFLGLLL